MNAWAGDRAVHLPFPNQGTDSRRRNMPRLKKPPTAEDVLCLYQSLSPAEQERLLSMFPSQEESYTLVRMLWKIAENNY
jgi:hypothetical protein